MLLHQPHRPGEQIRLVRQRHAHVDVEHMSAHRDLILHILDHLGQITRPQRLRERLTAGRIDPLPDDAKGLVGPDQDLPRPQS